MSDPWMRSETVPRCENCGLRLERDEQSLCNMCAYRRKKQAQRAATAPPPEPAAEAKPATRGPDVDELRERLRRVEEGLRE